MKKDIRMEAIGGQGAHSAGKILAEAAVVGLGFTGNHFSSFGSEKRGSPVRSSIRYRNDGRAIRSAAPILRPDFLVIFHQSLIDHASQACEGSHSNMTVIVNSAESPDEIAFPFEFKAMTVCTVDALSISRKYNVSPNGVMLGALIKYCTEIPYTVLASTFSRFFSHLSPDTIARNIRAMKEGYEASKTALFNLSQPRLELAHVSLPRLGYENAPIGGVISNPGNTILRDMSHSRKGTIPLLDFERCIHCGYCDMVCPDYCFVWQRTRVESQRIKLPSGDEMREERQASVPVLQGIDYRYCKGCQKCIQACPVSALKLVSDTDRNRKYCYVQRFHPITTEISYPVYSEDYTSQNEEDHEG